MFHCNNPAFGCKMSINFFFLSTIAEKTGGWMGTEQGRT